MNAPRQVTRRVLPLPSSGDVFMDARDPDKGMRVSWHPEAGVVVVSLWRGNTCAATFRLEPHEVPRLISALAEGLAAGCPGAAGDRAS